MKLIEIDLFKYHDKPEDLKGHHEADDIVPERIYNLAKSGQKLTVKQEDALIKDGKYAYLYAHHVVKGRFPKGEDAIAKDAYLSYWYARDIIKGPFSKGEAVIAADPQFSYLYARDVFKGPWPKGEAVIAKDKYFKMLYVNHFKVKL